MVTTGARGFSVSCGIDLADEAFFDIFLGNALHRVTELGRDELRRVGVDHVVDLQHLPLLHQELDDVDRALGHAVGEFLDCDGFWQLHHALNFDPFLPSAAQCLKLLAFPLAFERGEASLSLLLVEGVGKRQPLTAKSLIDGRLLDRRSALRRLARAGRHASRGDLLLRRRLDGTRGRVHPHASVQAGRRSPELAQEQAAGLPAAGRPPAPEPSASWTRSVSSCPFARGPAASLAGAVFCWSARAAFTVAGSRATFVGLRTHDPHIRPRTP